jgi:hypothetical protein
MLRSSWNRCARVAALVAIGFSSLPLRAGDKQGILLFNGWSKPPCRTPLQEMAAAVDYLEREIDGYGSVVVKQPDVWGEARWTKHRQDYEKVLAKELENFKFTVNASIREADTSFLLNAAALGNAVDSDGNPGADVTQILTTSTKDGVVTSAFPQPSYITQDGFKVVNPQGTEVLGVALEPTEFLDQMSRYIDHLNQLRRINEGDDTADAAGYALNLLRIPVSVLPGEKTRCGYGAEVTMTLTPELTEDLLPTTFKDLVLNDLVDQLGLPLVKLVDQQAWNQVFSEELTSALEADLCVLQDLQKCFAPNLNLKEAAQHLKKLRVDGLDDQRWTSQTVVAIKATRLSLIAGLQRATGIMQLDPSVAVKVLVASWENGEIVPKSQTNGQLFASEEQKREKFAEEVKSFRDSKTWKTIQFGRDLGLPLPDPYAGVNEGTVFPTPDERVADVTAMSEDVVNNTAEAVRSVVDTSLSGAQSLVGGHTLATTSLGAPRDRKGRYPVAPTEIACVFGRGELAQVAQDLDIVRRVSGLKRLHLPDVQGFLTEELDSAYRFLVAMKEGGTDPWQCFCQSISKAVRRLHYSNDDDALDQIRQQFMRCCDQASPFCRDASGSPIPGARRTCNGATIQALSWAILVESALLNDHLLDDMRRVEKSRQIQLLSGTEQFYEPNPDLLARTTFNEYVRARWPIHVFAIDPENQEQNVADAYARRRETQLALALAFTSGQIGANNFSRFSRRLDFELDTISLNRTVVGFSHGDDTFGWRIYPRVQAPQVEGNLKVACQSLFKGGPSRDQDLKHRQLEPGSRELLAIVIMPSFVPSVRMDVRGNWFHLTNPHRKQFSTEDSVRLGQMVSYLRQCKAQCTTEEPMGRPGDTRRLLTAVDQLEKRLPLQEAMVQIPYENSVGGFQLFSEGTRNLGPELIGFYGEPGVNSKATSYMFLVGRHFNVNVTRVVIGGQDCTYDLLSREVMRVQIPKDTVSFEVAEVVAGVPQKNRYVDAHVATPYGVSGHLLIPVVDGPSSSSALAFDRADVNGCLNFSGCIAAAITTSPPVRIDGLKKDVVGDLTISASAILANGETHDLAWTAVPTEKSPTNLVLRAWKAPTDKPVLDIDLAVNTFLGGPVKVLSYEKPAAIKLTAKFKVGEVETSIGSLLIKLGALGGCSTCVSGCGQSVGTMGAAVDGAPICCPPATVPTMAPDAPPEPPQESKASGAQGFKLPTPPQLDEPLQFPVIRSAGVAPLDQWNEEPAWMQPTRIAPPSPLSPAPKPQPTTQKSPLRYQR